MIYGNMVGGARLKKQVQSDYNQNDSTQSDYVKNRPFFTGDPVVVELADIAQIISDGEYTFTQKAVDESNVFMTYSMDKGPIIIENITIAIGNTYSVLIDGTKYTYVAYDYEGSIAIGDIDKIMLENYSEANVAIVGGNDGYGSFSILVLAVRGSSLPTELKLLGQSQEIKKIDDKYIPDNAKNSNITINGKSLDENNSLNLIPSDIGASKIIYLEETDKHVTETQSEIQNYIDSGYDVRLIANSLGGKCMIRLDNNFYIHISDKGDLHKLKFYSAFISSNSTVTLREWNEGNGYHDLD